MHDGHHVVHHFRFGRQPFLGEHQHVAAMGFGVMFEPRNAEAGEAVLVSKDQHLDLPSPDLVHTGQKPLRLKFSPPPTSSIHSTPANPVATTTSSSTLR